MKFTVEDLKDLTLHQINLIINFSLAVNYADTHSNDVKNMYVEGVNLIQHIGGKLKLNEQEKDFIYNFFLENDHY